MRPSTKHLQALFLSAVAHVAPAVLVTLRDRPLSALRENTWSPGNVFLTPGILGTDARLRRLHVTLDEWSAEWHLQDDWCREWACSTLGWWRVNPWCPTAWFNPKPTSLRTSPHPPPPIFDPTAPRADYKERHSAYMKSIEQVADTHHLVKTPEFRQPAHFYWLAGYHVRGWSQNIIAEAADVRRFAVQYAINTLSARLGLTPRADRPKALRGPEHDSQRDEIARLLSEVS